MNIAEQMILWNAVTICFEKKTHNFHTKQKTYKTGASRERVCESVQSKLPSKASKPNQKSYLYIRCESKKCSLI